jgi:hypothetical protein
VSGVVESDIEGQRVGEKDGMRRPCPSWVDTSFFGGEGGIRTRVRVLP